jgi:preprotein translocase subunit SecG
MMEEDPGFENVIVVFTMLLVIIFLVCSFSFIYDLKNYT